jgi:putative ABC transport system permease protein
VLKAIGATSFFVYRQLLAQVVAVALIGVGISFPAAYLTEQFLQSLPDSVPIALNTGTFISTGVALLITAVIGSLISGRQVLKVEPIVALGQQQ